MADPAGRSGSDAHAGADAEPDADPDADPVRSDRADRIGASTQVFVDDPAHPSLSASDHHHLARVLRLSDGERVVASDGRGTWVLCGWRSASESLAPLDVPRYEKPMHAAITVAFAPAKGDRPEWVVQKLTELGVDVIVPLVTERGVVRWPKARAAHAVERLRRVAESAAAQSRRVHLPRVVEPVTLGELAELAELGELAELDGETRATSTEAVAGAGGATVAMADPGGDPLSEDHRVVAVGPEGGWGPAERHLGLPRVTLATDVLRSETAAVAAGVLLAALRAGTVAPSAGGSKGRRAPG